MSMFVQLVPYPEVEEFLYLKSKPVSTIDSEIVSIAHKMAQIMYDYDGIGISAPQIGINKRIIVLDCTEDKNNTIYLINPVITWQSETFAQANEECLSYPGLKLPVLRPRKVKVEGLDLNGKKIGFEASGIYARCLCHEIDHLDGIPFTKKVTRQVRRYLMRKWKRQNELV